jgi:HNH endonuclease/NUMOD4 motif
VVNRIWADCPGYEGIYQVSRTGKVRRVKASQGTRVGYVLAGVMDGHGYLTYTLRRNGLFRSEKAHRLVCLAFNGPPPDGQNLVNHLDGKKRNNAATNLAWCSHAENTKHAYANGLVDMTNRKGAAHPRAQSVVRVGKDGKRRVFSTIAAACLATPGARRDRVWAAFTGALKSHAGFKWEKL